MTAKPGYKGERGPAARSFASTPRSSTRSIFSILETGTTSPRLCLRRTARSIGRGSAARPVWCEL